MGPVVRIISTSLAGSVVGYLYGGLFAYVSDRLLSDDASRTLVNELLDGWFAAFGWAAGLLVGAIVGVAVVEGRCNLLRKPREEDAA